MASNRLTLFPSEHQTISNMTAEFENFNGLYMLQVKGLKAGDELLIEFEMGNSECDPFWVPLVDCCGQVKLVYPKSFLVLPMPMRYRAVLTDTAGAYLTDPSHFSDVMIQGFRFGNNPDLSKFYHSCCTTTTTSSGICTNPITASSLIGG